MAKFSSFLIVLLLMLTSFTAGAQEYPRGDVNQDGAVNISDVTALIDYLLTNDATGISLANADSDLDGRVNIADVTALIDYLLTGTWEEDPVIPPAEGDWVDLGLPSGTIWATRNVGASSPEDYGDYFAWGETAPKDYYSWSTYKWCKGSYNTMTKYCTNSSYGYNGFTDGKTELEPADDAAYVNWGSSWRMPSKEQIIELCNSCTWQWTQRNGVNGQLGTGPNGNTIFLPAAGDRWNESLHYAGSNGLYWSRTLYPDYSRYAYGLSFYGGDVGWYNYGRICGFAVRAVRISQE